MAEFTYCAYAPVQCRYLPLYVRQYLFRPALSVRQYSSAPPSRLVTIRITHLGGNKERKTLPMQHLYPSTDSRDMALTSRRPYKYCHFEIWSCGCGHPPAPNAEHNMPCTISEYQIPLRALKFDNSNFFSLCKSVRRGWLKPWAATRGWRQASSSGARNGAVDPIFPLLSCVL